MIYGFMHVYTVGDWKRIVVNQLKKIEESLLGVWMETLYVGINGPPQASYSAIFQHPKIEVLYCVDKAELEQSLTLSFLRNFASVSEDNHKVFYIHTKGVTHKDSIPQADWRTMMEYYTITRFKECLKELEESDIVGTNWHFGEGHMGATSKKCGGIDVTPHFSGNFWWANTAYLSKLPVLYPLVSKYQCEFWIGKGNPFVAELWNSGMHHHRHPYPEAMYKGKINVKHY
jgi:hypothetical protein